MKLTLNRKFKGQTYTIGDLSIDGKFFCNTIEDAVRELPATCPDTPRGRSCTCKEKVYSKTAIPAGTYKVTLQYSPKYKKKMPYLHDVPHFLGILIHSGNTEGDSAGCIIVGKKFHFKNAFNLSEQSVAARRVPRFGKQPPAVPADILFSLAAAYAFIVGFALRREPFPAPAIDPVPAVLVQVAAELRLAAGRVFRCLRHRPYDLPVRLEGLLRGA